jgi:hypothetical protein
VRHKIDCIFCGDNGVQRGREDVFPVWLANKLAHVAEQHHPGLGPEYTNYAYSNLETFRRDAMIGAEADRQTKIGAIPVAYKLPDVCRTRNHDWMGNLEQNAKLLMPGLMAGTSKLLAPYDQFVLATWAMKTCLTYDAARQPQCIPEAFGSRDFFKRGYPLLGANIVIGHDPDLIPDGSLGHGRAVGSLTN